MKLIRAIINKLRKADADAAEALTDHVVNGKFVIADAKKQIAQFNEAITKALAQNRLLEKQLITAKTDVEKYAKIAKQAVAAGSDNDATEAIQRRIDAENRANQLQAEISKNAAMIDGQRKQLKRAEQQVLTAENNHAILAARQEASKARIGLGQASNRFGNMGGPLAALNDLQREVEKNEAIAEATEEISGVNEPTLEEKYNSGNSSVSEELAKLKSAAGK